MTVIQGPKGSTVTKHERRKNMRDRQLGFTNEIRIEFLKKRINKEDLHSGKLQNKVLSVYEWSATKDTAKNCFTHVLTRTSNEPHLDF